jgi:hypothetical protein
MQTNIMNVIRVQLITGQEYLVDTPLTVEQFDDKIAFGSQSDFIVARHGIRLQISKILTHQPLDQILTQNGEQNG